MQINPGISMNVVLRWEPIDKEARFRYVVDFLNRHPLCPDGWRLCFPEEGREPGGEIFYGSSQEPGNGAWHIPAQKLLFAGGTVRSAELHAQGYACNEGSVFSVESKPGAGQAGFLIREQRFGFDLFETLFFHLSRYEEFHATGAEHDRWDRMKSGLQFLVREGLHRQPVVDRLAAAFWEALGARPTKHPSRIALTHDIDILLKFPTFLKFGRAVARQLLFGRPDRIGLLFRQWRQMRQGLARDPYDTFDRFFSGKSFDSKMVYFLAGGITRYDRYCQIGHPYFRTVIDMARNSGYGIGLHPSYAACCDLQLFEQEKRRLEGITGETAINSRQHFLHFSFHHTPAILEASGIREDSTLGYRDRIGFRCGTGFPYRFYDLMQDRPAAFREAPMVIMDSAVLMEARQSGEDPETLLRSFMDDNASGTCITINFHNSSFDEAEWDAELMRRLYEEILRRGN